MIKRENFADSLMFALHLLGWSPKHLADHLSGKYRVGYLTRVCEGRPIGDVEKDIVWVVVHGLAEKLKRSIMSAGIPDAEEVGKVAAEAFVRIVRRFDLQLCEITRLAEILSRRVESAHSFRTQTLEILDIEFWDSVLGDIAIDLSQGSLFQGEQIRAHRSEELSLLPNRPMPVEETAGVLRRTSSYPTPPDECWNCRRPTADLITARCHCGKNWNIPD